MNWVVLLFVIEAGMIPSHGWSVDDVGYAPEYVHGVYTHFESEVELADHFFFRGHTRSIFGPANDGGMFHPSGIEWQWSVGARARGFEIGFRHMSTHPVIPYMELNREYQRPMPAEGGYNEVYVRVEKRIE